MSKSAIAATSVILAVAAVALPANPAVAGRTGVPVTTRVSVSSSGAQAHAPQPNFYEVGQALTADGRYVAFGSRASNLVPNDTNDSDDIFVRDLRTRTTTRVNVSSAGAQGHGNSHSPSISANGRYVAFVSEAADLADGESPVEEPDIFVRDREAGTTVNITGAATGSPYYGGSADPEISGDGRYVTFSSYAANLVPGDTNGARDIFVHDLQTHVTTRASVSTSGRQGNDTSIEPAINRNGRYVTYYSGATNLVAGDTNEVLDIFLRDMHTGTTTRVSASNTGGPTNGSNYTPDISADGRYITFKSDAGNLLPEDTNTMSDIFVRDMVTGTVTLASVAGSGDLANDSSDHPVISADGSTVAFASYATNLVARDTNQANDVFVRDLVAGTTTRISASSAGGQSDDSSWSPAINANGDRVVFFSYATNLVRGDTNEQPDVFLSVRG